LASYSPGNISSGIPEISSLFHVDYFCCPLMYDYYIHITKHF
jgi:hypothetical protein